MKYMASWLWRACETNKAFFQHGTGAKDCAPRQNLARAGRLPQIIHAMRQELFNVRLCCQITGEAWTHMRSMSYHILNLYMLNAITTLFWCCLKRRSCSKVCNHCQGWKLYAAVLAFLISANCLSNSCGCRQQAIKSMKASKLCKCAHNNTTKL